MSAPSRSLVCSTEAVVRSERYTESSRTIHCPRLFEDARIISWRGAVDVVNGHYSLEVMTKQNAFILAKTLLSLSLAIPSKRINTHLLYVYHAELDLNVRGSVLLADIGLSKIYFYHCRCWLENRCRTQCKKRSLHCGVRPNQPG